MKCTVMCYSKLRMIAALLLLTLSLLGCVNKGPGVNLSAEPSTRGGSIISQEEINATKTAVPRQYRFQNYR